MGLCREAFNQIFKHWSFGVKTKVVNCYEKFILRGDKKKEKEIEKSAGGRLLFCVIGSTIQISNI